MEAFFLAGARLLFFVVTLYFEKNLWLIAVYLGYLDCFL